MPTSPGAVASNVRAELARRRISQQQAAADLTAAGIETSQQKLNNRLTGRSRFTVEEIAVLAGILGVPMETLVAGSQAAAVSA